MSIQRKAAGAAVAGVAAGTGLLAPATAGATSFVSPTSGLRDGSTVTITSNLRSGLIGSTPSGVSVYECQAGAFPPGYTFNYWIESSYMDAFDRLVRFCTNLGALTSDSSGSSGSVAVRSSFFTTELTNTTVNCVPSNCDVVTIGSTGDGITFAADPVNITFSSK